MVVSEVLNFEECLGVHVEQKTNLKGWLDPISEKNKRKQTSLFNSEFWFDEIFRKY